MRPQVFTIRAGHPLAKGLAFAGLGAHPGSTYYHDSSLYGVAGTLINGPVWNNEQNRRGLTFVGGATEDYVNCGGSSPAISTGPITIALWHKAAGDYTTSQALVVAAGTLSNHCPFATTFAAATDNKYEFWNNEAGGAGVLSSTLSVSDDTWRHIAFTRTGRDIQIFIDGALDNSGTVGTDPNAPDASTILTFSRFGLYDGYYLIGQAGQQMLWTRVLSPAEIQLLADRSDPMLGGLIEPIGRRVFYVAGAPAGLSIPIAMHHYLRMAGVR